jgi:hypothetical protein
MSDLLSPSPYAYLDDIPPAERQAAIQLRQHRANAESSSAVALARRARDYQAELAEEREASKEAFRDSVREMRKFMDANSELQRALARIAELEAALEPFARFIDHDPIKWASDSTIAISTGGPAHFDASLTFGHLRRARSALRNR